MSLEGKSQEEVEALAKLADDVLSKPDTAGVFQRLIKKNNPGVSMPLIELEDKAREAFAGQRKEIDGLKAERAQDNAEKQVNLLFEELRDDGAVTTRSSFNELVKWASENGFMTTKQGLKKAAMQRASENEAAEPTPQTTDTTFQLAANKDVAGQFMKDHVGTARSEAAKGMDAIIQARRTGKQIH